MRFNLWLAALLCLASFTAALPAVAHEGHDDGSPAVASPISAHPRAVATSESYEIVAVPNGSELSVFVDRFLDNTPVTDAKLTISIDGVEFPPQSAPGGVFKLKSEALLQTPGEHEFIFSVQESDKRDLLIAGLSIPVPSEVKATAPASAFGWLEAAIPQSTTILASLGAIGILGLALAAAFKRRLRRKVDQQSMVPEAEMPITASDTSTVQRLRPKSAGTAAAAVLFIILAVPPPGAFAHGDEDHGDAKQPTFVAGDSPRRLPDASVYLPKLSQRLLDVRTVRAAETTAKPSLSLVGRIIANPNRSGLVQSTLGGRFTLAENGLPVLGQAVKAGDVLGYITPYIAAIDKSDATQTAGNLDQEIALAETRLERAKRLFAVNAGTRVQVEDTEIQLNGLQARRAALNVSQTKPEPLIAPIDGVIASAKVVAGQVVGTADVLFQLVNPSSLWVEAFLFDPSTPNTFTDATALAQGGTNLSLSFIGQSRTLQQQSTVLNFEIKDPPASLNVGMPVTVMVRLGKPVQAIILPKAAVVRASNGENIVWLHTEPERFVARSVRINPFDGDRVLVAAGLETGQRVVVQGAELVNQVR
ncbi:efflux RND transporter periplasmic adaptor subunit [Hyphomicrobium sp.]|jgi:RND family efflux transporter MFP subunit|uniref:efflux RND transporter periplasmic adaptor subunit n=1 Tax=Hyphomicrobium sp. TaxID=82 RepID=UPI003564D4FF